MMYMDHPQNQMHPMQQQHPQMGHLMGASPYETQNMPHFLNPQPMVTSPVQMSQESHLYHPQQHQIPQHLMHSSTGHSGGDNQLQHGTSQQYHFAANGGGQMEGQGGGQQMTMNGNGGGGGGHDGQMVSSSEPVAEQGVPVCLRTGCTNHAVPNSDWEDEYCSNECVITHCRDVFGNWVQNNNDQQQANVYPSVVK